MKHNSNQLLTEEQRIAVQDYLMLKEEMEKDLAGDEQEIREDLAVHKDYGLAIEKAKEYQSSDVVKKLEDKREEEVEKRMTENPQVRETQQFGQQGGSMEGFLKERGITPEMVNTYKEQLDQEEQSKGAQELQDNQTPPEPEQEVTDTQTEKGESEEEVKSREEQSRDALANPSFNGAAQDWGNERRRRQEELDRAMAERLAEQEANPERYENLSENFEDQGRNREVPEQEPEL